MGSRDKEPQPPKIAKQFLLWFIRDDLAEEVEGDLLEKYIICCEESSTLRANLIYWYQVTNYLRPFAIRNFSFVQPNFSFMFRNYLKITFRNIKRQKLHSTINILGLSIALTAVFLMLLWVNDEQNIDKFHQNEDRLYRVKRTIPLEGDALDVYRGISYPMLKAAVEELPEVDAYMPIGHAFEDNLQIDDLVIRAPGTFANADYFRAFSFPILHGDIDQLDKKVDAMAISESLASRLFGPSWQNMALGKTVHIHDNGDFTIEAIYADFPERSSLQNDFVFSFQAHLDANEWMLEWSNNGMQGALLLSDASVNPKLVGDKLQKIFQSHQEGDRKEGCFLQKFSEDYLFGDFDAQAQVSGGRIEYVRLFSVAALLLLIVSCINFVNLATARATNRAKEVGVRKTIGANRNALISQFLIEAFVVTGISVILALIAAGILLPSASQLTQKTLHLDFGDPLLWITLFGITITTGILAGAYPAFMLSSFRPIHMLRGKVIEKVGDISFRRVLVVVQFTLSLLLIVGAMVVHSQIQYIQHAHLGIDKDNLMTIHQDGKVTEKYNVLKLALESDQAISGVTVAGPSPHNMQASTSGVSWPAKRPDQANIEFSILWTASNFPEVFNIPLSTGRFYRKDQTHDTTHIVFNERAIQIMELEGDPVGQTIQWWGKPRQIIGVLKDFHNRSFYERIEPAGFLLEQDNAGNLFVKAEEGKVPDAIAAVQWIFKEVVPDVPLHYDFVDEQYRQRYRSEMLTGKLTNFFAIISIIISCLGLLGLINFVAEQKTREIGIRKVLGASMGSLVGLLSKDFIRLAMLGFVLAIPFSYYLLTKWLERFAYQVEMQWWQIFLMAGMGTIVITLFTISFK
ncbi:MAG: FtsX-like permease family protein, partial [Saprospiraceae bacterium]|nr:FtsX-like permease family protein [Saprospiraceae bacterium]